MIRKRWSKWSRCRAIMAHLAIQWITMNILLTFVLYNTSTCFDYTEYRTIATMALFGIGVAFTQYQVWKVRHAAYLNRYKRAQNGIKVS